VGEDDGLGIGRGVVVVPPTGVFVTVAIPAVGVFVVPAPGVFVMPAGVPEGEAGQDCSLTSSCVQSVALVQIFRVIEVFS